MSEKLKRPILIAGPCSLEHYDLSAQIAERLGYLSNKIGYDLVFKGSFDKANRTSGASPRGLGLHEGSEVLRRLKATLGLRLTTDVHEVYQAAVVADVVDVIQIPALLSRQTDLIESAARTGKTVNIKKGQFMGPREALHAVGKSIAAGNEDVMITERGTTFGYNDLVVDFRSLIAMKAKTKVIFDATHSVQRPSSLGASSGGDWAYSFPLAKAAAAVGVDGFFFETHPHPEEAVSDAAIQMPLHLMEEGLTRLYDVWCLSRDARDAS